MRVRVCVCVCGVCCATFSFDAQNERKRKILTLARGQKVGRAQVTACVRVVDDDRQRALDVHFLPPHIAGWCRRKEKREEKEEASVCNRVGGLVRGVATEKEQSMGRKALEKQQQQQWMVYDV